MKKSFKFFAVAIAAIMTIGTVTLVSCDKEDSVGNVINQETGNLKFGTPTATEDDILFAANDNGTIIYGFDLDDFSTEVNKGTNTYVVEIFEVIDSMPNIKTGWVEAHMVLYNVIDDIPESYWFPIKKVDNKYYIDKKAASNSDRSVKCKPNKKCDKGCDRVFDNNNNFRGCKCSGDGACKESEFIGDIIETIGNALEKVLKAIGDLFN